MKPSRKLADQTEKLSAAAANRALLAAFKDPGWHSVLTRATPEHRSSLLALESRVKDTVGLLTADQLELINRIRSNSSGILTVKEGHDILEALEGDLQRENRREIVTELRASAVSTAAVERLREAALDWDALMAQPEQTPLIEGVLTEGALAVLIGAQGIGKSFLTLDWCLSVATGTQWLGRQVQQRRVLYVVGEGADGLPKRLQAWAEHHGVKPEAEHFRVLPYGGLDDPRAMRTLAQLAAEDGAGLVVLDTLSSLAPEAEKAQEAPRWLGEVKALRESLPGRGTVLVVHHSGVSDATRARNSSALEANPDEVLVLTGTEKSALLTLRGKKVKDGPGGWTVPMQRHPSGGSCVIVGVGGSKAFESPQDAHPMTSHPIVTGAVGWAERVLAHLVAVGAEGATQAELREALGVVGSKTVLYDALNNLKASGRAVSNGAKRHARFYAAEATPAVAA